MKPLNLDNRPCSPISSNCVVWQGPTLDCINLCTGDTVSDVVAKLATELCTLLDQTNVNNYDLTCLGIAACGPKDFQALIQLLIEKICELQGVTPTTKDASGCPDCVVTVADCFQVGNQTTMQLLDYVQMIAEKVCALIDEIASLQTQINNLDVRVTVLENTPPPTFTLPSIQTNCLASYMSGAVSATIDLVLDTLLNDPTIGYCSLIGATGLPGDLLAAVAKQCITSGTPTLSDNPIPFGTVYSGSWIGSPVTVADSINNIWIAICDIYEGVANSGVTIVDAGPGIDVTSTTVGLTTTYTVSTLGAMNAQSPPLNQNTYPGPTGSTNLYDGEKQIMTEQYDDDNAYDPATGLWTCPVTGRYNLSFYIHMTNNIDVGFASGMVIAGIVSEPGTGYYAINTCSVGISVIRHIDITGQALGVRLVQGLQLKLMMLNLTNVNYVSSSGDVARFVVQRVG
jgi:hypothetical protein